MKYFFVSLLSGFLFFITGSAIAEKLYVMNHDGTVSAKEFRLVPQPVMKNLVTTDYCDMSLEGEQIWWDFVRVWAKMDCGGWPSKWVVGEGSVVWVVGKGEKPEPVSNSFGQFTMACYTPEAYWQIWDGISDTPSLAPSGIVRTLRCQYLDQGGKG